MNDVLASTLSELKLGAVQTCQNLAVFPVLTEQDTGPEYMTLSAAIKADLLQITETSHGGSVPELRVINKADLPVLILDGEELKGAKQNRVSNTTVLVPANKDITLDVSCTERGRWSYNSERFSDSNVVMSHRSRRSKNFSVSEGLRMFSRARSDQGEVWREIDRLHEESGVHSPTGAMRDVFEARMGALNQCMETFTNVEGQCGVIVLSRGKVIGMDRLSRSASYSSLHEKLVKSYVIDTLSDQDEHREPPSESPVRQFLEQTLSGSSEIYPSTGLGEDVRITSNAISGSALVYGDTCIHVALFVREDPPRHMHDDEPQLRGFHQRRRQHL